MTAITPTGWCAWCGQQWALTTDGTLRAHRAPGQPDRCLGTGRRPTVTLRTARTSPAQQAQHRADLIAALTGTDHQQPIPARPRRKASR